MRKLTIKQVETRLKLVHGDTVTIMKESYISSRRSAIFMDNIFGSWEAVVKSVLKGGSHPTRAILKRKQTTLKVYGVENVSQSSEIKNKKKITSNKNYGVDYPGQNELIKEKKKKTCLNKRGVENPFQSEEVKEKIRETCIERYGFCNPNKNTGISLKVAKSSNKSTVKFHWKTNEELVCQGSYEAKTVDYLNFHKINFEWQPKTFEIPTDVICNPTGKSTSYRPDLFLPDCNLWVEIKGLMRPDAQIKWDWFKSIHPNSELWDRNKLKELGIEVR